MAANPTEIDPKTIVYSYPDGTSSGGSGSGGGLLSGILGAIPGIISALFPNGVGGGNSQSPVVTTLPSGQQQVSLAGNNSNILMLVLIGMVGYLVFTGRPAVKVKR